MIGLGKGAEEAVLGPGFLGLAAHAAFGFVHGGQTVEHISSARPGIPTRAMG